MKLTSKKILSFSLLLLLSGNMQANMISNVASGLFSKVSGDKYTIYDIEERFTSLFKGFLRDATRKPRISLNQLAQELSTNDWPCLAKWLEEFASVLLNEDKDALTEKKIAAIGKKIAKKHLSYSRLIQLNGMLNRLKKKFENDPTLKTIDWYMVLELLVSNNDKDDHHASSMIDTDITEVTIQDGKTIVTETHDHIEYDKAGHEIEHDHFETTTEIVQQ